MKLILIYSLIIVNSACALYAKNDYLKLEKNELFKVQTSEKISFAELINHYDIIFLGEKHDEKVHHKMKTRLINEALKQGYEIYLLMEYLSLNEVSKVANYNNGLYPNFSSFAEDIKWKKIWGFETALEPVFEFLNLNPQIKIIATDLPTLIVKKISKQGINFLSQEEKELIGPLELNQQLYFDWFKSTLPHQVSPPTLNYYFESFISRNTRMAKSFIDLLKKDEMHDGNEEKKIKKYIFLMGNGHLEFQFGVPYEFQRLYKSQFNRALNLKMTTIYSMAHQEMREFIDPQYGHLADFIYAE